MKRKRTGLLCWILVLIFTFGGCGNKMTDEQGNARIQSEWQFTESSVNGSTLNVENDSILMKELTKDINPRFICSDDLQCEFMMNGKNHRGVVTEEGNGKYRIDFDDNYKSFFAEISGNRMKLQNEKRTVTLIFKVKQE